MRGQAPFGCRGASFEVVGTVHATPWTGFLEPAPGLDQNLASCRHPFVSEGFVIMYLARSLVVALVGVLLVVVSARADVVHESEGGWSGFVKDLVGWFGENDQADAYDRLLREMQRYDSLSSRDKASVQARVEGLDPSRRMDLQERLKGDAAADDVPHEPENVADEPEEVGFFDHFMNWLRPDPGR